MDKRLQRIKYIKSLIEQNLELDENFDFFDELEEAFGRSMTGARVFQHGPQKRSNPVAAISTGAGKATPSYSSAVNAGEQRPGTRTVSPKVGAGATEASTSTTNTGHTRTVPVTSSTDASKPTPDPKPVPKPEPDPVPDPNPDPPPKPRPRTTTDAKKGVSVSGDNNKLKNTIGNVGSIGGNLHQGDVTNIYNNGGGGAGSVTVSPEQQASFVGAFAKGGRSNVRGSSTTFTFSQKRQPLLTGNMNEQKINRLNYVKLIMEKINARRYSR